jgi:multiple sugar transport system permease protein
MITDNNYLVPVLDRWRLRTERILESEYEKRLRELQEQYEEIPENEYAAFVMGMEKFIEETIRERVVILDDEFAEAFEKGKELEPATAVKFIYPVIFTALVFLLIFFYLRYMRKSRVKRADAGMRDAGLKGWLTVSPWVLGFTAFLIGPILASILLSFTEWNLISDPVWVGFQHYHNLLQDDRFLLGLERTLLYALFAIPISLFGGLFTAGLLTMKVRGTDFFKAVFYFPSLFTGAAAAVLWINMFNKEHGVINYFLSSVGITPINWLDEEHAFYTVVLMNIFWVGSAMIIYYAGMKQIPKTLYEAADIDGAGFIRKFVSITIPMLAPVIFFMVVITTIGAFQVFTPALFFAPNSSAIGEPGDALRFYSVNIYDEAFNKLHMGKACSYAIILFAIIFIITMVQVKLSKRYVGEDAG